MRKFNNIYSYNRYFDAAKPIVLLNSYLDTVKPNSQYTNDPFKPIIKDGKLYGLGSNDAGGALVSLISVFLHFYMRPDLPYNLCLAVTAEEENSGQKGIKCLLDDLMPISFAIVGEPTGMEIAIAEKGSMVLDCFSTGGKTYSSTTSSDQGWLSMPSVKMGPGDPARSHTADEYIYLHEINDGITIYIDLLESLIPYLAQPTQWKLNAHQA